MSPGSSTAWSRGSKPAGRPSGRRGASSSVIRTATTAARTSHTGPARRWPTGCASGSRRWDEDDGEMSPRSPAPLTHVRAAADSGADPYPRFTDAEIERRRALLTRAMTARGAKHAILYGANRSGSAISWLTHWPVTREAVCVFTPGERDLLLVDFYNHVP